MTRIFIVSTICMLAIISEISHAVELKVLLGDGRIYVLDIHGYNDAGFLFGDKANPKVLPFEHIPPERSRTLVAEINAERTANAPVPMMAGTSALMQIDSMLSAIASEHQELAGIRLILTTHEADRYKEALDKQTKIQVTSAPADFGGDLLTIFCVLTATVTKTSYDTIWAAVTSAVLAAAGNNANAAFAIGGVMCVPKSMLAVDSKVPDATATLALAGRFSLANGALSEKQYLFREN